MNHPYKQYEKTPLWITIAKAIDELKENQDISITTKEEYVIGFLCKKLTAVNKKITRGTEKSPVIRSVRKINDKDKSRDE